MTHEQAIEEAAKAIAELDHYIGDAVMVRYGKRAQAAVTAYLTALGDGWCGDMSKAPRDGTPVLLKLKSRIPKPDREDLRIWDGLTFVGRHPGVCADGFDIGWNFAAPVGTGGFPDEWFEGWMPIPVRSQRHDGER